jgi:HSP20 family molecular chaperone IbpA
MAESIQNKNADRTYIREIQQEKNTKKKELAEQQREDIKQIKTYYAEKNKEIDEDSAAAINHIKTEQTENDQADRFAKAEERRNELDEKRAVEQQRAANRQSGGVSESSVYNREGRMHSPTEKKSLKSDNAATSSEDKKISTPDDDAFYSVVDRGSTISEAHDGYFIEAYAPASEKDNIRVSIMSDKAIISGKRKFQDSTSDENKSISTNNFQTYREEFKLARPVAANGMTRERDGDFVKFFIPKLETTKIDTKA